LEVSLTPGQKSATVIKLYNETQEKLELYTEVRAFTAKGETGQPDYEFSSEPVGFATWVQVQPGPITLDSGQRVEVPVTFDPPADAGPGGHYATVFFSTTPPESGQLRISSKVGTLILGKVAGAIEEKGAVSEFGLSSGKTVYTRPPIDFFVKFANAGNVHLRPTGTITISNIWGKEVDTVEVNASRGATLPNTTRKYEVTWEKKPVVESSGSFLSKFFREYGNEKNNFAFGKYTANVTLTIGAAGSGGSTSLSFWVVPWHILAVWIVILAVVVLLFIMLIKRYNKWILKKAQSIQKK
jgi:hypothetical protein